MIQSKACASGPVVGISEKNDWFERVWLRQLTQVEEFVPGAGAVSTWPVGVVAVQLSVLRNRAFAPKGVCARTDAPIAPTDWGGPCRRADHGYSSQLGFEAQPPSGAPSPREGTSGSRGQPQRRIRISIRCRIWPVSADGQDAILTWQGLPCAPSSAWPVVTRSGRYYRFSDTGCSR